MENNNNSRTYLQGLFDRFPSSKPALDGTDSDGEYQIYEQESNGLDDDGDEDDGDDDEWRTLNIMCIFIVIKRLVEDTIRYV